MRRTAIVCVLVLAACAKADNATPAADTTATAAPAPAALSLADLAGTWDATVKPMDRDTVLTTIELTATGTTDGWSMKLPNGANPAVTVLSVSGDSVVTETGQFASATRPGQQVSSHNVWRLRDGKIVGVIHAKYSASDTATLRFEATKKPPQ